MMSYRLRAAPLSLDYVYNGLSLQLLTSLLVLQANGVQLTGKSLGVAGAFALQVPREIKAVNHPNEAASPDAAGFHLTTKPRGIFSLGKLQQFDRELQTGRSEVLQVMVKKDGEVGAASYSDVADEAEFQSLLQYVERQLGELADRISAGNIAIAPYRMGDKSPCVHCGYQSVCRFSLPINRYRRLKSSGRVGVLSLLREGAMASETSQIKWTDPQRNAIETVDKSLLVSAAAGSGKTAVLAERCVHLVCDAPRQCDVDDLLVVTFTDAAAAQMKSRIGESASSPGRPRSIISAADPPAGTRGSGTSQHAARFLRPAAASEFPSGRDRSGVPHSRQRRSIFIAFRNRPRTPPRQLRNRRHCRVCTVSRCVLRGRRSAAGEADRQNARDALQSYRSKWMVAQGPASASRRHRKGSRRIRSWDGNCTPGSQTDLRRSQPM